MEKQLLPAMLECISFKVADTEVLIERHHVLSMISMGKNNRVNDGLKLTTIEELLGLTTITDLAEHKKSLLALSIGNGQLNLEVSDPVELVTLTAEKIHPLPILLASRIKLPSICALAEINNAMGIIVDPCKF